MKNKDKRNKRAKMFNKLNAKDIIQIIKFEKIINNYIQMDIALKQNI